VDARRREHHHDERVTQTTTAPILTAERITNLDTVRGIATLGILIMNAVSFALPQAAYFNLDADGTDTWLDRVIGVAGEIFVDQKAMALFSMLFGAGIVLFADRAEAKGKRPVLLSLWRNGLLLAIGLLHGLLWEGDVLLVYALCSPLLLVARRWSPRTLIVSGTAMVLLPALIATIMQTQIAVDGAGLGDYWFVDGGPIGDDAGIFLICGFFLRAAGMMFIGVALFRTGIIQGQRPAAFYRNMAIYGLLIGLPIATAGVIWQSANDWSPAIALIGEAPNTIATIPVAFGYLGLITLWTKRMATRPSMPAERLQAVGRIALTNYLAQTVIGVTLFSVVFDRGDVTRTTVGLFIVGVWAIQLWWSTAWLERFRFGPAEWAWRCLTYRSIQPLRRAPVVRSS
jgi:uncharacterized protein